MRVVRTTSEAKLVLTAYIDAAVKALAEAIKEVDYLPEESLEQPKAETEELIALESMSGLNAEITMVDGQWRIEVTEPKWLVREIVKQMEAGATFQIKREQRGRWNPTHVIAVLEAPDAET